MVTGIAPVMMKSMVCRACCFGMWTGRLWKIYSVSISCQLYAEQVSVDGACPACE